LEWTDTTKGCLSVQTPCGCADTQSRSADTQRLVRHSTVVQTLKKKHPAIEGVFCFDECADTLRVCRHSRLFFPYRKPARCCRSTKFLNFFFKLWQVGFSYTFDLIINRREFVHENFICILLGLRWSTC
jgi:hypothetical protein